MSVIERKRVRLAIKGPAPARRDDFREVAVPAPEPKPLKAGPVVVPVSRLDDFDEVDEDEIRLRMEEWDRWSGDGVDMVRSSVSIVGRIRRELHRSDQAPLPLIGIEAGLTDMARQKMPAELWGVLVLYYLRDVGGVRGLAKRLSLGKTQAHSRLKAAHESFWTARRQAEAEAKARRKAYQESVRGEPNPEYAMATEQDRSVMAPGPVLRVEPN